MAYGSDYHPKSPRDLLLEAAQDGDIEGEFGIRYALAHGADINAYHQTVPHSIPPAPWESFNDRGQRFCSERFPFQDCTALQYAILFEHTEAARYLIEHGAEVNIQRNATQKSTIAQPLHMAAARGNEDIVQFLLERGANPNTANGGGRASDYARRFGHTELGQLLLQQETEPPDIRLQLQRHKWFGEETHQQPQRR